MMEHTQIKCETTTDIIKSKLAERRERNPQVF